MVAANKEAKDNRDTEQTDRKTMSGAASGEAGWAGSLQERCSRPALWCRRALCMAVETRAGPRSMDQMAPLDDGSGVARATVGRLLVWSSSMATTRTRASDG